MPKPARTAALLTFAATGVLLSTGFPFRVGLTKSQSHLSMPGDLLLPTATVQADRALEWGGSPADSWPNLLAVEGIYSKLWGRPLELIYQENPDLMVWQTTWPSGLRATVAATLTSGTDGRVRLQVRERYLGAEEASRWEALRWASLSACVIPLGMRHLRRSVIADNSSSPYQAQ